MDYIKKVNEVIEEALTEKTFNLEIIGKIKDIRDELAKLQESDKTKDEVIRVANIEIGKFKTALDTMSAKCIEYEKREKDLSAGEKILYQKEQTAANEKAKCELAVDLFKTVFRNTEVRENIYKNVQVHQNGYTSQLPESENRTKEAA